MDPTLKARTLAALKLGLPDFPPRMRICAKYIIDHPADFGLHAIRVSAQRAGVSTYSFVKLAKILQFSGFDELRAPFRHALIATPLGASDPHSFDDARRVSPLGHNFADAAENAMTLVRASLERQTAQELGSITKRLMSARHVYVTAVRSSYALAYYTDYVARMALPDLRLIPRHASSALDDLIDAGPEDVLIAITVAPYSRSTIEACQFAKHKGVTLILVSDSEVALADLAPAHCLAASTVSTHRFGSIIGLMAILEVLLALLMTRGGTQAQNRIAHYEDMRHEHEAYWSASKKTSV